MSTPAPSTSPASREAGGADAWGLTSEEVASRRAPRAPRASSSASWSSILRRNALTPLNGLLVALGSVTLATGALPDATFLGVAVANTLVGTAEEARAKRQLDALALLSARPIRVRRDGRETEIAREDLVDDDVLELRPGDQVAADGVVVREEAAEVDESLISGEATAIRKSVGDAVVSGSWLVAGSLAARATAVGDDSYAGRLAASARTFDLVRSELVRGVNRVLRWLAWCMVILAPILFAREVSSMPWRLAVRLTVAGLVGMVPEGLVLLTTIAFLAGALRLGRRGVLVQELPAVESLARVDALCTDKTGTLTESGIRLSELQTAGRERAEVESALAGLAQTHAENATLRAIREAVPARQATEASARVAFRSDRRWSAASFTGHGTWVLGAPDVFEAPGARDVDGARALRAESDRRTALGNRTLLLAHTDASLEDELLPPGLSVVALLVFEERPRPTAPATLRYFDREGVTVRIVSGDDPVTTAALATQVGLSGAASALDARELPEREPALGDAVLAARVLGRATPEAKQTVVEALQGRGHVVAMTGDGVNDVLALKHADLGIAMGSGSEVARGVAQLVLLRDDFDQLPEVVGEGRRVLANIELVSALFFMKNAYSALLSVVTAITGWPYPFLPRQLTLVGTLGIGIPAFVLSLGPNERRFVPGFLRRSLVFAALSGGFAGAAIFAGFAVARAQGSSPDAARVASFLVAAVLTLWVLGILARPLTWRREALLAAMTALLGGACVTPGLRAYFALDHVPSASVLLGCAAIAAIAILGIELGRRTSLYRRWTGQG